jgi:23S rRNA pseudouridine955/2504/2580 synthase
MNTTDSSAGARLIEVAANHAGQRIDNFLLRTLKGVPKSLIYRLLRQGAVRVNRARIRPDYRVQTGDQLRIPPLRLPATGEQVPPPPALLARLRDAVLWEDRDLLVLDKPAGIAVHKGSGLAFGVIELVRTLRPELSFLELAHRLDRETSGCLVLAKTPAALRAIHDALRAGQLDKRYLALVRGRWEQGIREVAAPLRKVLRSGEHLMEVAEEGKPAITRFKPVSLFRQASLLEVQLNTGRTHQIRVHAAYCNHPVAGDDKYGAAGFNREMQQYGLRRLFLHAHSLVIVLGGREIAVSAPLDEELRRVLGHVETQR